MRNAIYIFLILGVVFIAPPSYSNPVSLHPDWLYSAIKESCPFINRHSLQTAQMDKLRAGYFPGQKMTQLLSYLAHNSFESAVLEINMTKKLDLTEVVLSTPSVKMALLECYPNDPQLRQFFLDSISRSDRAGKIVGVGAIIVLYKFGGAILAGVKSISGLFNMALAYGITVGPILKSDSNQDSPQPVIDTDSITNDSNIKHLKENRINSLRSRYLLSEIQMSKIDQELTLAKNQDQINALGKRKELLMAEMKETLKQLQVLVNDLGIAEVLGSPHFDVNDK